MSASLYQRMMSGALLQLSTALPAKIVGMLLIWMSARFMSPLLYGEYSLALAIYGVSDLLTNPSAQTYFIRTPGASERALNSAWTVNVVRGAALTLLFWWLAPWIAALMDGSERVTLLLELLSISFFLAGARNTHVVSLFHKLDYARIARLESVGGLIGGLCGLALLWVTHSPAALAASVLISALIGCALTWVYAPRAPALALDRAELIVVWRFVRFLMMNNVIFFLLQKLDDLFIGKIAGAALLGIYAFAYNTSNNSLLFLTNTLRQVLLPALVSQLEERERFRELALRAISTITNVSWVICVVAFVGAEEIFVYLAPGERWVGAAQVFQALLPFVLVRALNGVFGSMMTAVGSPQVLTVVSGLQLVTLVPGIYVGFELGGLVGVALAIGALNYATNLVLLVVAKARFELSMASVLGLTWAGAPAALVAALAGLASKSWVEPAWARALVSMLVALAVSLALWELGARVFGREGGALQRPSALRRRVKAGA